MMRERIDWSKESDVAPMVAAAKVREIVPALGNARIDGKTIAGLIARANVVVKGTGLASDVFSLTAYLEENEGPYRRIEMRYLRDYGHDDKKNAFQLDIHSGGGFHDVAE